MNDNFKKIFYDESDGIARRARDGNLELYDNEMVFLKEYIDYVIMYAKDNKNVLSEDFKNICTILEYMEASEDEKCFEVSSYAYYRIGAIIE